MKIAFNRLRFWDHPVLRRAFWTAPRGASAGVLLTLLGMLCLGALIGRLFYYDSLATVARVPPPAPMKRVPGFPSAMVPSSGTMMPGSYYYAPSGWGTSPSISQVNLFEPLPQSLQGRQLVRDFGWLLALLGFIVVPGSAAQTYLQQRKKKTFDLLFLTRLKSWSIVLGDWVGIALPTSLALMVTLPVFTVSFAFGGVSLPEIAGVFLMVFASVFAMAAVGLFCSIIFRSLALAPIISFFLCIPIAVMTGLGVEVIIVGPSNFLDLRSAYLPLEISIPLFVVTVAGLVSLNFLWWTIADFEFLFYQQRGEPPVVDKGLPLPREKVCP